MTIKLRTGGEIPELLFAGLMIHGPDPDGSGYEEVAAHDYERQRVDLYPYRFGRYAVIRPVTFEASAPFAATHIGIFTSATEGELLWFGGLRGSRYAPHPSSRIYLPAYQFTVTRPAKGEPHS